ncbi:HU-CCDC81 and SPOR domain-containing protein [Kitasatospora sp. NPDC059811]|uniref:pPIWI_RE_Y domain-containing protein n=1 Tax=Streptomycetaceae TaxID=2062 RepID=UPI0007AF3B74|nr:HU-CCDC81 and SPOR domain-containing protein [Streptomyces sp. MJM8645]
MINVPLLHVLATAIIEIAEQREQTIPPPPYPPEAQRALDQVVLECLRGRITPPSGLPELISWCRTRPLDRWPLQLADEEAEEAFGSGDVLIDRHSGMPTELCLEWKVDGGKDSAARQYDRRTIAVALQACLAVDSPESYTRFRRVLVDQPVLTSADWSELAGDLYLCPVVSLLSAIYPTAPDHYLRDGRYTPCERCRTLLVPLTDGGWWCERDECRQQGPPPPGRSLMLSATGKVLQLRRPLRQFVTGPGRAEVGLEDALRSLGLTVEMWPAYDAYDLRVTFPDDHVWAIDVKDRVHPGLLGRKASLVPTTPPYHEACWVVPRYRVRGHHDYLGAFRRARPASARGLHLLVDDDLVLRARARLRGGRGSEARLDGGSDA